MKIIGLTKQQAGETAEALQLLVSDHRYYELNTDLEDRDELTDKQRIQIAGLLDALQEAERGNGDILQRVGSPTCQTAPDAPPVV